MTSINTSPARADTSWAGTAELNTNMKIATQVDTCPNRKSQWGGQRADIGTRLLLRPKPTAFFTA